MRLLQAAQKSISPWYMAIEGKASAGCCRRVCVEICGTSRFRGYRRGERLRDAKYASIEFICGELQNDRSTNMELTGIHHLTAISAAIKDNHRFYTQTLGMRLVKRSV